MQRGWKHQVFLLFALLASLVAGSSESEQFDEELLVKPLRDGRVAATFAFSMLLNGASPRDPYTLNSDDECNVAAPRDAFQLPGADLKPFYFQLNIIPYSLFHWAKFFGNMPSLSFI